MANIVVDIATPPTGQISIFNLYMALSRSPGHESIRLLRDFDSALFRKTYLHELLDEDDRLANLAAQTKREWQAKLEVI